MNEDLRDWFGKGGKGGVGGGGWDRYNTKGERIGKCAREPGEPKPKCLSKEKAAKMSKDEIAAAVRRKREKDPVADRPGKGGKPKMVSNKIKEELENREKRFCQLCGKKEYRFECGFGPELWDKYTIGEKSFSEEIEVPSKNVISKAKKATKRSDSNIDGFVDKKDKNVGPYGAFIPTITPNLPKMKKENTGIVSKIVEQIEAENQLKDLEEKNTPTNPSLWSKMKTKAKSKFDVYPSAYANAWAAKEYKKAGGKWKSVSEDSDCEFDIIFEKKDDPCWSGWKQVGMKKKNGKMVPNCVKEEELEEAVRIPSQSGNVYMVLFNWRGKIYAMKLFFPQSRKPSRSDVENALNKVYPGAKVRNYEITNVNYGDPYINVGVNEESDIEEDWQKVNKQDKTDGMSQKAVKAYRRENPGSKLKTAVTEKDPGPERSKRRKSFCARSKGQQDMHNIDCSKTPDKAICKARRRWRC